MSANNAFTLKGPTLKNILKPKSGLFKAASGKEKLPVEKQIAGQQFIYPKPKPAPAPVSTPTPQQQVSRPQNQTFTPPAGTVNVGTAQNPIIQGMTPFQTSQQQTQRVESTRTQPRQEPTYPTYTGLISELSGLARSGSEDFRKATENLSKFRQGQADVIAGIESQAIPIEFQQGRAQAVQRAAATKEAALEQGVANALAAQQQQFGALGAAAGMLAPIQAPYSNQILQFGAGGQLQGLMGGAGDIQSAVSNVAQKVASGQMSYDQGVQALSGYGQAGVNMLQQSLPSGFNVAQSETLARQQGQVAPAIENARLSLNKLEETMNSLAIPGQTSGFVPLNELTNWASRNLGWGKQQTAAVNGMVNEVRNALQNALSLTGTNPTEATAQSYSLLPDNPSMQNLLAAKQVLEGLGTIKQQVYGTPGLSGVNQGGNVYAENW